MSMWEIEALIEDSVRLVATSTLASTEKKQLIYNLYEIQGQFDCSFTHFRLMPLLLEVGYAKTITPQDYPNYQENQAFFKEIQQKSFEFIYEKIGQSWGEDNQVGAYWDQQTGKIYYDFASSLWLQLGNPESPLPISPMLLVKQIMTLAHQTKQRDLIYHWAAFSLLYEYVFYPDVTETTILKESFRPLKKLFHQYDFKDFEPIHDSFDFKFLAEGIKEGYFEEKVVNLLSWFLEHT